LAARLLYASVNRHLEGQLVIIPILIVRNVSEAITFLTGVLDFELAAALPNEAPFYAVLTRGADELHLNLTPGQGRFGHSSAIILCDDVDALFASFRDRGLSVPTRPNSPVHEGPLNQTWGTREVYIDDPSGNTLVFQQRSKRSPSGSPG
jgi:catechol 2,3-dioxygenase-like lactoylglutathione lyase family enzyme